MFSDRSAKPCPQQIPTYSGRPSKDFITFIDKFKKAAEDNRISKRDQLEKLREAWSILEKTFGDPLTHLNYRLGVMKATQPLSDKSIETDPNKAAAWFLQYEKAIESILRMGVRSNTLGIQCFNASTIYKIC